jgi:type VI secretion system secreted protein VgrG
MSLYGQAERRLQLKTPLGDNKLLLDALRGVESLSEPFLFQLSMVSEEHWIDPTKLVGQPVSFGISLRWPRDGEPMTRWFHGVVRRFVHRGRTDRLARYVAEVVPLAWFLTRRADARIFQEKSVPEIVAEVLKGGKVDNVDRSSLRCSYPPREYCVQYRESDHDFFHRLLEDEGIFYYYKMKESEHVPVLADAEEAYPECEKATLHRRSPLQQHDAGDDILRWEHGFDFQPGRWAQRDYNFKTPSNQLETQRHLSTEQAGADPYEVFGFPGGYMERGDGERLTRVRMEAEDCGYDVVHADTVCPTLFAGGRFKVGKHPIEAEEGKEWVVTRVEHIVQSRGEYESGSGSPLPYVNRVTCIPASVVFRPARRTPRPVMHGIQTAMVVGPSGEEIYVDKYGRVKVQFHWDRYGKKDERSSCWIRVAHPWAGLGFGGLAIPRIGQEVVVEFEEGNPDRPLINGRVYNAEQIVPVSNAGRDASAGPAPSEITAAAMMTTLKSNSLGGSGGYNEITMNDTGGAEGLFIKAQKDNINNIGNDQTTMIGHDREESVGNDHTEIIGNNSTQTIRNNQTVTVGSNTTISIGKNKTENIGMMATESVGAVKTVSVGAAYMVNVGAAHTLSVGGAMSTTVSLAQMEDIGKTKTVIVGDKVSLTCGSSKVTLDKSGKITVEGKDITVKASGKTVIDSSGPMKLKGSKIDIN